MAKRKTIWKSTHPKYLERVYTRRSHMRRRKLAQLSEAQGHRCAYCCGETFLIRPRGELPKGMSWSQQATLEHLIPVSKPVQTNKDDNLVMACSNCNHLRGDTDYMAFFNKIRRVREAPEPKPIIIVAKDPAKLKAKEGRTLAYCLIIAALWPGEAADIAEHWQPYVKKLKLKKKYRNRRKRPCKIAEIARIVTADSRRMAA